MHIKTLHFKKNPDNKWYIILPDWQGDPEELEMVSGADTMLDIISGDGNECVLCMSDAPFEGATPIALIAERETENGGGGDYILMTYNSQVLELKIWFCEVTRWVWGNLPPAIYFRPKEG